MSRIHWPYDKSLHLDLSLGCTGLAVITSVLASQISLVTPYVYLCYDYITRLALYVHHQYFGLIYDIHPAEEMFKAILY